MTLLTIIIASFNRGSLLEETLRSIRDQRSDLSYEVIIVDNMSTDCTLDVLHRFCSLPLVLIREGDRGMYSAIAKGISRCSGQYICYINCGDLFDPYFFATVTRVDRTHPGEWYIGLPTSRNEDYGTTAIRTDFYTSSRLIKMGYHNGFHDHFLQQESIFWHKSFNDEIDLERLASFRLAGDSYLWLCFALVAEPIQLGISISGYTHHANPLSEDRRLYMQEFCAVYNGRGRLPVSLIALSLARRCTTYLAGMLAKSMQAVGK